MSAPGSRKPPWSVLGLRCFVPSIEQQATFFCPSRLASVGTQDRNAAPRAYLNKILRAHVKFVALQDSTGFMDADAIKNKFHIAYFRGCSTLCNKNTFEPDLETKSLFVPGNTILQRIALEATITKAHFRRVPKDGITSFAVMLLHSHNDVAKRSAVCTA